MSRFSLRSPLVLLCTLSLALAFVGCSQSYPPTEADSGGEAGQTSADVALLVRAADVPSGLEAIDADSMRERIAYLSADELGGRGTATPGEAKAAEWIAQQMSEIGLEPFDGDWFQEVRLLGSKRKDSSTLTLKGPAGEIAYTREENLTFWSTAQKEKVSIADAPLAFVGYGVEAPEVGWDDFKGFDASGKVLVFLNNDPPVEKDGEALFGGEARTYYGRWTYKFEQAMRHGAAGAIMIHTTPSAGYGWQVISDAGSDQSFAVQIEGTGYQVDLLAWMQEDLAGQLASTAGKSLEQWISDAESWDFTPVDLPVTASAMIETELSEVTSRNVMGRFPGSDPELADELIVFTAHYDHLGTRTDENGEEVVYNGAWDNAAGTAAILEAAKGLVASEVKPRRSVVFLACAAEEKGSLGSRWFVANPPVPAHQLVANINIDMPQIFGLTRDLAAIGKETNTLGGLIVQVAEDFGVPGPDGNPQAINVTGDPNPNAGSFYRSDQVNFAKAGIPALYVRPGSDFVDAPWTDPKAHHDAVYHQPGDMLTDAWDLSGLERDTQLLLLTALNVANADAIPRWTPGNEFEGAWKALHGR